LSASHTFGKCTLFILAGVLISVQGQAGCASERVEHFGWASLLVGTLPFIVVHLLAALDHGGKP
jgi:hypothetical protein